MLTWCRSAVNRASLSVAATRRTRPRSLSAPCPALGPGRVSLVTFPLAGRLPSTPSAAPPWALFGSFTGSTRPSDFSRSSITGLRPWPSPHDPPLHHDRRVIVVGSPGGISPPGSHGSRRDSLPSPGSSHQPSVVADQAPVNEERGLPAHQPRPPAVKPLGAPQSLVLLRSPAPQVGADTL